MWNAGLPLQCGPTTPNAIRAFSMGVSNFEILSFHINKNFTVFELVFLPFSNPWNSNLNYLIKYLLWIHPITCNLFLMTQLTLWRWKERKTKTITQKTKNSTHMRTPMYSNLHCSFVGSKWKLDKWQREEGVTHISAVLMLLVAYTKSHQ